MGPRTRLLLHNWGNMSSIRIPPITVVLALCVSRFLLDARQCTPQEDATGTRNLFRAVFGQEPLPTVFRISPEWPNAYLLTQAKGDHWTAWHSNIRIPFPERQGSEVIYLSYSIACDIARKLGLIVDNVLLVQPSPLLHQRPFSI